MSNLQINVVALGNFGNLQSQLGALSAQIASVNQQLARTGTALTIPQMRTLATAFDDIMMRSGQFTKETVRMSSAAEQLGQRIAKNRVNFRDVTSALGNLNKQTNLYNQLGQQQVRMSRSIVQGIGGGMANVYTATATGMESAAVRAQVLRESVMASNAALKAASNQVINFGKNTQWAGRQLTAGLSMPLVLFGGLMAAQFYEIDKNLTRLSRVYGVGLQQATTAQLNVVRNEIMKTSQELANSLGVSAQTTTDLAAELAAAGLVGNELINATKQAARITVLGEVDKQEAVKATIALQTAYRLNTQELTDAVNFFNAAQAATSTNMQDLVEAVPKVGPVIKGLGGSYKDLVAILTSMKEGGVPAAEAANAIKNSLGRIINPTNSAQEKMMAFGINLKEIVATNAGDLVGMLTELQDKLDGLTKLQRSQAIAEIFGKFQFARMTAFFDNFNKSGTQSAKVMQMMGMSSKQLEDVAKRQEELIQQSASGKFQIALQKAQQALLPMGATFLTAFTEVLDVVKRVVDFIDKLPDGVKSFLKFGTAATILVGPLVMATGLFANLFGTIAKGAINFRIFSSALRMGMNPLSALTSTYRMLTPEIVATESAAAVFGNSMGTVAAASQTATRAIMAQITALQELQAALSRMPAAAGMPAAGAPAAAAASARGAGRRIPFIRRSGGTPGRMPGETGRLPGFGGGDIIPALLEPGEFIVNKNATKANLGLLHQINQGKVRKYSVGDYVAEASSAATRKHLSDNQMGVEGFFAEKRKAKSQVRTSSPDAQTVNSDASSNIRDEERRKIENEQNAMRTLQQFDKNRDAHTIDQALAMRQWYEGLSEKDKKYFIEDIRKQWPAGFRADKLIIPPEGLTPANFDKFLNIFTRNWSAQIMPMGEMVNSLLNNMDIRNSSDELLQQRLDAARATVKESSLVPGRPAEHFSSIAEMRQLASQGAPFDFRTVEKLYHYAQVSKDLHGEKPKYPLYSTAMQSLLRYVDLPSQTMSEELPKLLESRALDKTTYNPEQRRILLQVADMMRQGASQPEISKFWTSEFVKGVHSGNLEAFITGPGDSTKPEGGPRDPKSMLSPSRDQHLADKFGTRMVSRPGMVSGTYYSELTMGSPSGLSKYPELQFDKTTKPSWFPWVKESPFNFTQSFATSRVYMGRLPGASTWNTLGASPLRFFAGGGMAGAGTSFLGMPRTFVDVMKAQELKATLAKSNLEATTGRFANLPVTELGQRMQSIGGHSSAIPGINGIYEQNGIRYVVKTHDTADSALAELRGTQLTRDIFGLKTPAQELVKIQHPTTGDVVFAVRSPYDETFAASSGKIGKDDFFGQALSAIIRRDKDLQPDNLYNNVVADVGAGYVANKASQPRIIGGELPSVADQAAINFLMSKGGARKWFTEHTADLARGMTEKEYVQGFQAAIKNAAARVNQSIEQLPYLTETERKMYSRLTKDLEDAAKLDWSSIYNFHKTVVPEVKKPPTAAALAKKDALAAEKARQQGDMAPWQYGMPYTFATGGRIPGFGGGDIVPAMVEPGEFIINKDQSKKFGPLLHAINSGKYGKFSGGTPGLSASAAAAVSAAQTGNVPPYIPPDNRTSWKKAQDAGKRMATGFSDGVSKAFTKEGAKSMVRGAGKIGKELATSAGKGIFNAAQSWMNSRDARRQQIAAMTPEQRAAMKQEKMANRQMWGARAQGIGMAAMLGSGTVMQMTGGGNPALNYGLLGAGFGGMLGPYGLLAGAGIGAGVGLWQMNSEAMQKEAQARIDLIDSIHKSAAAFTDMEQQFLGTNITDLLNIDTSVFSALGQSTDQVRAFTEALKNAEQGTVEYSRIQQFAQVQTAQELINSPAFQSLLNQSIGSGVGQKKLSFMIDSYLNAANKIDLAPQVNQYIADTYGLPGFNNEKFVDQSGTRRNRNVMAYAEYARQAEIAQGRLAQAGITMDTATAYTNADALYQKLSSQQGAVTDQGANLDSLQKILNTPGTLDRLFSLYLTNKAGTEFAMNSLGYVGGNRDLGFGGKNFIDNADSGGRQYITDLFDKILLPFLTQNGKNTSGLATYLSVAGYENSQGINGGNFADNLVKVLKGDTTGYGTFNSDVNSFTGREVVQMAAQLAKQYNLTGENLQSIRYEAIRNAQQADVMPGTSGMQSYINAKLLQGVGLGNGGTPGDIQSTNDAIAQQNKAMESLSASYRMIEAAMGSTAKNALSNLNSLLKSFDVGLANASDSVKNVFSSNLTVVFDKLGPDALRTFQQLQERTGSWREALMGVKIALSDVGYSLQDLNNMSDIQIKTIINRVERSTTKGLPASTLPSADAIAAREAAAAYDTGGGGGGAPDTSAIDKQVEALQKKIDAIRQEREQVAKLNAEYQKNMDYQQRRLDLENQMREALAGGNLLQYAQLQQEKQAMETQKKADEQQAKGDKRAENRIKKLEDQIAKLQKQKSDMSSGGSGGGSAAADPKPKPPYDIASISASLSALAVPFENAQKFLNSKVVQPYIKMLKELGYTNGEITREITYQWNLARQGIVDDYSNLKETQRQMMDSLTNESLKFRNFTDEAKAGLIQTLTTIVINPANTKQSALSQMVTYLEKIGIYGKRATDVAETLFKYANQRNDQGPRNVTLDLSKTSNDIEAFSNDFFNQASAIFINNGVGRNKIENAITLIYKEAISKGLPRGQFIDNLKNRLYELLIPQNASNQKIDAITNAISDFINGGTEKFIRNYPLENTFGKDFVQTVYSDVKQAFNEKNAALPLGSTLFSSVPDKQQIKESTSTFLNEYAKSLTQGIGTEESLISAQNALTNKLIMGGMKEEDAKTLAKEIYAKVQKELKKRDLKINVSANLGANAERQRAMDPETARAIASGKVLGPSSPVFSPTDFQNYQGSDKVLMSVWDGKALQVRVVNISELNTGGTNTTTPYPTHGPVVTLGNPNAQGGPIGLANGSGAVFGPGTWTSDSIPAMLSQGEYVVKARSVAKYGRGMMDAINAGHYNIGGMVNNGVHYLARGSGGNSGAGSTSGAATFVNVIVSGISAGTAWMTSVAEGIKASASIVQDAVNTSIKFGVPEGTRSGIDWITGLSQAVVSGAINVYTSFQVIMEGIKIRTQNTANQIMAILETTLGKGFTFDIVGKPKMFINSDTVAIWQKVMGPTYEALVSAGEVQAYGSGGKVVGPGGPTEDKIPAMLSDGEFVVRAASVKKYGLETLNALNEGTLSFAMGGAVQRYADGGIVKLFSGSPLGEALSKYASQFTGTPYSAASYNENTGPISEGGTGWGCATAMQWLYSHFYGIGLPDSSLSAAQMAGLPTAVPTDNVPAGMLPGDLLYFYYKNGVNTSNPVNHTGMYIGNNQMFHARSEALGTQITGIDTANLRAARRVLPPTEGGIDFPTQSFAWGGLSLGAGGSTDDQIPAMLSNGEFVIRARAVKQYGVDFMRALNQGLLDPSVLQSARARTFSSPSMNDTMVRASDARATTINNQFNITGDNPKAIAEEVVKVLNVQQKKIGARTRI